LALGIGAQALVTSAKNA